MNAPADATAAPLTSAQRKIIAVVFIGMMSTTFPISILSVSLPMIADEVGMSPGGIAWVITAPLLANTVAAPILGKLGDIYGHRPVYIGGFALATLFAFATSLAWSGMALIVLRTLGQLCGAATGPSGLATLLTAVGRERRLRVIGWWSMVAALAPSLGLVFGGPLIDAFGWRAVFVVQSVPALVCVVFAWKLVPATPRQSDVTFDIAGALTLGGGLLGLMLGVNRGAEIGWVHPVVIASLAGAPIFLVAFWQVQRRVKHPLIPLDVLGRRNVHLPLLSQPLVMGPFQGAAIVAPFLMIEQFGFTATAITVVALCRTASFGLFGGAAGRFGDRLGERATATIGTFAVVTAMVLLAWSALAGSLALLTAGMLLTGAGAGFSRPPFASVMSNAVDESQLGIMSASSNLAGQAGSSLGVTGMMAVLSATEGTAGFTIAFAVGAVTALGSVICALGLRSTPRVDIVPPMGTAAAGR